VQHNFGTWAGGQFNGQSDPNVIGATATPENDGTANLLKYAFDINPARVMSASDLAALPAAGFAKTNGISYLTLTYRQNPLAGGVTVNVETSSDLLAWQTVTPDFTQSAGTDPATNDPLVEVGVAMGTATQKFIRLNVTSP
jgi:hypothetical protein